MTPKEKADRLVFEMFLKIYHHSDNTEIAKKCALVAVDEILDLDDFSIDGREYWQEVRDEIEKL